jgi:hypothetical protein
MWKDRVKSNSNAESKEEIKSNDCSIWLNEIKWQVAKPEYCYHLFCYECLKGWRNITNKCPLWKIEFLKILRLGTNREFEGSEMVEQKNQLFISDFSIMDMLEPVWYSCQTAEREDLLLIWDDWNSNIWHTYCLGYGEHIPEGACFWYWCLMNARHENTHEGINDPDIILNAERLLPPSVTAQINPNQRQLIEQNGSYNNRGRFVTTQLMQFESELAMDILLVSKTKRRRRRRRQPTNGNEKIKRRWRRRRNKSKALKRRKVYEFDEEFILDGNEWLYCEDFPDGSQSIELFECQPLQLRSRNRQIEDSDDDLEGFIEDEKTEGTEYDNEEFEEDHLSEEEKIQLSPQIRRKRVIDDKDTVEILEKEVGLHEIPFSQDSEEQSTKSGESEINDQKIDLFENECHNTPKFGEKFKVGKEE